MAKRYILRNNTRQQIVLGKDSSGKRVVLGDSLYSRLPGGRKSIEAGDYPASEIELTHAEVEALKKGLSMTRESTSTNPRDGKVKLDFDRWGALVGFGSDKPVTMVALG